MIHNQALAESVNEQQRAGNTFHYSAHVTRISCISCKYRPSYNSNNINKV